MASISNGALLVFEVCARVHKLHRPPILQPAVKFLGADLGNLPHREPPEPGESHASTWGSAGFQSPATISWSFSVPSPSKIWYFISIGKTCPSMAWAGQ